MSAGSDDASVPFVLYSEGWEYLPDGRQQLLVQCKTILDFVMMPEDLVFGEEVLWKAGWDSEKKIAFYRPDAAV